MEQFPITEQNRVRRVPKRADYERKTVYQVVDAALICHVGFVNRAGQATVIPTIHARDGDTLLLHGASTSRLMEVTGSGQQICVTVTHVDGLVLARSVFHHSMNYRSAVLYGQGHIVEDPAAKMDALARFTEKLIPGRWDDARQPTETELKATHVVAIPIDIASAKIRTGGPKDDEPDYDLDVWAGVLPMTMTYGEYTADDRLKAGIPLPDYLEQFVEND